MLGLRSAVTSAPVSVRSRSPRSANDRSCASRRPRDSRRSWSSSVQLVVDAPELFLDRRDQLLDRLPALGSSSPSALACAVCSCARAISVSWAMLDCSASALSALNDSDSCTLGLLHGREPLGPELALVRRGPSCDLIQRALSSPARSACTTSERRRGRNATSTTPAPISTPIDEEQDLHGPTSVARAAGRIARMLAMSAETIRCAGDPRPRPGGLVPRLRPARARPRVESAARPRISQTARSRSCSKAPRTRFAPSPTSAVRVRDRLGSTTSTHEPSPPRAYAASRFAEETPRWCVTALVRRCVALRLRPARPCRPVGRGRAAPPR